jgi:hypothetical protein
MKAPGRKFVVAMIASIAWGAAVLAIAGELKRVQVDVSDVQVDFNCGTTPPPGPTTG